MSHCESGAKWACVSSRYVLTSPETGVLSTEEGKVVSLNGRVLVSCDGMVEETC